MSLSRGDVQEEALEEEEQEESLPQLRATPNTGLRSRSQQRLPQSTTPQPRSLTFVNITGLPTRDVKTQRQIRQHVMRDIGRRRRKMASPDLLNLNLTPAHFNAGNPLASSSDSHDILSEANDGAIRNQEELEAPGVLSTAFVRREGGLSMGISRFSAGRIDPFVPWPVDLDARTRRLIDHLFTDSRMSIKFYLDGIFPIGLTGPASFYQILANLAEYLKMHPHANASLRQYEVWEGLYYHGKAMGLIKGLLLRDAVSDELVAAILGMACYSNIVQDFEAWRQHINALQEVIRRRGGPDDLNSNTAIRISLCWIDTISSGTYDIPPHWPIPSHLPMCRPILPSRSTLPPKLLPFLSILESLIPPNHEVLAICSNSARFATFLDAEVFRTSGLVYREAVFAGSIINTTLFQLLGLQKRPDANDNASLIVEAVRLMLILWMAEIRRSFGIRPILSTVHVAKLLVLLRMPDLYWGQTLLVKLLILGVVIVEAVEEEDLWWLGREWSVTAKQIGFTVEEEAQNTMDALWIKSVHRARFLEKVKYFTFD